MQKNKKQQAATKLLFRSFLIINKHGKQIFKITKKKKRRMIIEDKS